MSEEKVVCPHCHRDFALTAALSERIEARVRGEYEMKLRSDGERIRREAADRARAEVSDELGEVRERLRVAQASEQELRKSKRQLEAQREELDLEVGRRVDRALDAERERAALKLAEKDKLIADMARNLDETKRRAEQGSQQAQGEIFELELEQLIARAFPSDRVRAVPRGRRGADLVQEVVGPAGQTCGTILWESKRTKNFDEKSIEKLKGDARDERADLMALVSTVLPKEVRHLAEREGVWLCDFSTVLGLAACLRGAIVRAWTAGQAGIGRAEKKERLYDFVSSAAFRQRIEGLVSVYHAMTHDLAQERAAIERQWGKRGKQIDELVVHLGRLYGGVQGIIGTGLAEIPGLELPGAEQLLLLTAPDEG